MLVASPRSDKYYAGVVRELRKLPNEIEWAEFKVNDANPHDIGEYISALANSAALCDKAHGYIVWGIEDETHRVVGTSFSPGQQRVGNEELENWLLHLLQPRIQFVFRELVVSRKRVVLLEIERGVQQPVRFYGEEFIRIGSYKKKLKDFPEKEKQLWRTFDLTPFENMIANEHTTSEDVLRLLDYPAYFDLADRPLPDNREGVLAALADDSLVQRCEAGGWNITNLGATLFAKNLHDFPSVRRKAMRIVLYRGNSRVETVREQESTRGYASAFQAMISYINSLVPSNEVIEQALRSTVPMYPEIAVRELVANALIHQDFFVAGAGPMVELFDDRIEISNPGVPIVEVRRFLDTAPKSRNEGLASLMRRVGICEERGSGVDKVVFQTEYFQLPAPRFEVTGDTTRAILFGHRPLTKMDRDDRILACYLHACLKYVSHDFMTNTSIRGRFGIEPKNSAIASRLIKEATEDGAIRAHDGTAAKKLMKYVPFWA